MTECTISFESQVMKSYMMPLHWFLNWLTMSIFDLEICIYLGNALNKRVSTINFQLPVFSENLLQEKVLLLRVFLAYYYNTNIASNPNQTCLVFTSPSFPLLSRWYDSNCISPREVFLGNFSAKCFDYVTNILRAISVAMVTKNSIFFVWNGIELSSLFFKYGIT